MASKTVTRSNCNLGLLLKLLRKNKPGISRTNVITCRLDNEGLRERQINNASFSLAIETTKHYIKYKASIYNYVVYLDRLLIVMQNTYPETYKKKLQQGVYFIRKKFSNWTITVRGSCLPRSLFWTSCKYWPTILTFLVGKGKWKTRIFSQ